MFKCANLKRNRKSKTLKLHLKETYNKLLYYSRDKNARREIPILFSVQSCHGKCSHILGAGEFFLSLRRAAP